MTKNNVKANKVTTNPVKANRPDKRAEKFAKRRAEGKTYVYKPNPFAKGSDEWREEEYERAHKNDSKKPELQKWTSTMAKLNNQLEKEKAARKARREKK